MDKWVENRLLANNCAVFREELADKDVGAVTKTAVKLFKSSRKYKNIIRCYRDILKAKDVPRALLSKCENLYEELGRLRSQQDPCALRGRILDLEEEVSSLKQQLSRERKSLSSLTAERGKWLRKIKRLENGGN